MKHSLCFGCQEKGPTSKDYENWSICEESHPTSLHNKLGMKESKPSGSMGVQLTKSNSESSSSSASSEGEAGALQVQAPKVTKES